MKPAGGADRPHPTLYLVDGTSQLFRAYFAIRGLSNTAGLPTNATYGFTTMLRKLIADERPTHLAVVFDPPGEVFRHARFTAYKANRAPVPDDLNVQGPYAREVCRVLGVTVLETPGYEADDVIATYARRARRAGWSVVVVASDKDLLQLVEDRVVVLNPMRNARLDSEGVRQAFGVSPRHVPDVLGLMGDSVDNIPGVPGVGEKTAVAMVSAHGDLDAVLRRAELVVELFEARDTLLANIEPSSACIQRLGSALDALLAAESDPAAKARWEAVRERVERVETAAAPDLARASRDLARELRGLDRGSGRRQWQALRDHAADARLSKELATLDAEVPVAFEPQALLLAPPDRERAHALFETLGFRGLTDAFAPDTAGAAPAAGGSTEATMPEHAIIRSRVDLEALLAAVRSQGRCAIGVHSEGADPLRARLHGLALAHEPGSVAYVPLGPDPEGWSELARGALAEVLMDPRVGKVGHDLKAIAHVLRRHGMPLDGWELDTLVAAFLLDSSRGAFDLASLSRDILRHALGGGTKAPSGQGRLGFGDDAPEGEPIERVTEACAVALRLAGTLETRLVERGLIDLYRTIDGPLLPVLARMEAWGIRLDVELLRGMSLEMEVALAGLRSEVLALAGVEFNVDSPKQLREVLFTRLGLRSRRRTAKSGEASTDAQTLEELAADHPIASKLLAYRELAKLKGTYVDALPGLVNPETGRLHTRFDPAGAATGRLSSSDPNLQNIPTRTELGREIRAAFVPDPGWVFVASDYSQIELRVLAHLTQDPELIAAFRGGEDIHRHTAARIFGTEAALVTPAMRRRAKAVNFGVLYGMSETRLAREQGLARSEARRFIEAYFARFEGVRSYIDATRQRVLRDPVVRTLFERVRSFPQLQERAGREVQEQALRAAVNTTVQGTAADLMKLAMLGVDRALRGTQLGARLLLQVHDELLLEVREENAAETAALVRSTMEGVHALAVPLVVDQRVGRSWLEVS